MAHPGLDDMRAVVLPGEGLVARMAGLALVARSRDDGETADLLRICEEVAHGGPDRPGARLARALARWLSERDEAGDAMPEFGVVAASTRGLLVFLSGRVRVAAPGPFEINLTGEDSSTWLDRVVDWPGGRLVVVPSDVDVPRAGEGADWCDLRAGVVPGGGLVLQPLAPGDRRALEAARVPTGRPRVEPSPDGDGAAGEGSAVDGSAVDGAAGDETQAQQAVVEPVAQPEPDPAVNPPSVPQQRDSGGRARSQDEGEAVFGEEVQGVLCAREHLNDPRARFCVLCGIRMDQRSGPLVRGPRPPLGLLVLDDGLTVLVNGGYLVGREPSLHEGVQSGELRPLVLEDPEGTLSRVHAEIVVQEWDVHVVDRGSSNGTFVAHRDAEEWTRLTPGEPERLVPGMRLQLGSRVLLYESHHGLR